MSNLQRTPPTKNSNIVSTVTTTASTKRIRSEDAEDAGEQPLTLQTILATINDQFAKTLTRIDSLSGKIDTVKTELEGKLNAMSGDINTIRAECAARFEVNEKALRSLDERVVEIAQEIDGLANRNELILTGVPFLQNENLVAYFEAMWKHVGLHNGTAPPVDIRRLNAGTQNDGPILLQFALRNNRDDFYTNYLRKCDLKLIHLGIDSPRRIFINENLTVAARRIRTAALQLKKAGKVSAVYTKLGTVYIKRPDVQQPVVIRNEDQLKQYS